nr:TVP38/TMEM64 family protein [Desulfobacterales bacterium]
MPKLDRPQRRYLVAALLLVLLILLALPFRSHLAEWAQRLYRLLMDRSQTEAFIRSFGPWAPVIFMAVQVCQVVLALIPGEATGFIGGYLFGAWQGFVYSSISLGLGSWINFKLGRLLGRRFIRRLIPE